MTFRSRRLFNITLFLVLAVVVPTWFWVYSLRLRSGSFVSGWLLASFVVFLALYNVRKKFPHFPLLKSSTWLQFHIYVGLLSVIVFVLHGCYEYGRTWHLPHGPLNLTLGLLYALTAASGVFGLVITRAFPSRVTDGGEEVIAERIPIFLRQLRERAAELVVDAVRASDASTLPDFYSRRLSWFFARPRYFWLHLVHSRRPVLVLEAELSSLGRYLDPEEKTIADELKILIEKKHALDYSWALQGTLKGWLFAHVAMTYSLLMFLVAHVLVAYAFSGGVR